MVLTEFKIYEKNILLSLRHSLKTSCEKYNKKSSEMKSQRQVAFLSTWTTNKSQTDTCDLGHFMTQEYAESMPFFLGKATGKLNWSTEEFKLHSLSTKEII